MLQYDLPSTEFYCYGASQCFGRHRVLHVSVDQGSLTDTRLANKHYLDHLTELFNWLARCSRRDRHMMRLSATCTAIVLLMLGKCMWLCLNAAHISCGHAITIKTSHMSSLVLELGGRSLVKHITIFPRQSLVIKGELAVTLAFTIVLVHLAPFLINYIK